MTQLWSAKRGTPPPPKLEYAKLEYGTKLMFVPLAPLLLSLVKLLPHCRNIKPESWELLVSVLQCSENNF